MLSWISYLIHRQYNPVSNAQQTLRTCKLDLELGKPSTDKGRESKCTQIEDNVNDDTNLDTKISIERDIFASKVLSMGGSPSCDSVWYDCDSEPISSWRRGTEGSSSCDLKQTRHVSLSFLNLLQPFLKTKPTLGWRYPVDHKSHAHFLKKTHHQCFYHHCTLVTLIREMWIHHQTCRDLD